MLDNHSGRFVMAQLGRSAAATSEGSAMAQHRLAPNGHHPNPSRHSR